MPFRIFPPILVTVYFFALEYMKYQNYCWLLKLELQKVADVYVYALYSQISGVPLAPVSQAFFFKHTMCGQVEQQ